VASDAMIVSGLIAVLMLMYDGKTAKEILDIDPRVTFSKLELDRHLSSQRRNGLSGMVQRIRQTAAEALVANDQ
jgi:cysteine desulfuration protein SufE